MGPRRLSRQRRHCCCRARGPKDRSGRRLPSSHGRASDRARRQLRRAAPAPAVAEVAEVAEVAAAEAAEVAEAVEEVAAACGALPHAAAASMYDRRRAYPAASSGRPRAYRAEVAAYDRRHASRAAASSGRPRAFPAVVEAAAEQGQANAYRAPLRSILPMCSEPRRRLLHAQCRPQAQPGQQRAFVRLVSHRAGRPTAG